MSFTYEYPRPALTVDCVVFGIDFEKEKLELLLIRRDEGPFKGSWALPGGFVNMDESLDVAAERELNEETGIQELYLEQLYTYGAVERDPRERVVSVAYMALVNVAGNLPCAATDAEDAAWFEVDDLPTLAFDHSEIITTALQRIRGKLVYQPIGFELLPDKFSLTMLQKVYEIILDRKLDKRNFRKKLMGMNIFLELDEIEKDVAHRAARLYMFDKKRYQQRIGEGLVFEI